MMSLATADAVARGAPLIVLEATGGYELLCVAALAAAYLSEHYGAPLMLMGLLIGLAFNFVNADARLHAIGTL